MKVRLVIGSFLLLNILGPSYCQDQGATGIQNLPPVWKETLETTLKGIPENTPVGTTLGFLKAVDPEGTMVTYSADSDTLSVKYDTGEVKLIRELDAEAAVTSFLVKFIAYDATDKTTQTTNEVPVSYTFSVLDVNDNQPEFLKIPYHANVKEDAAPGTTVFSGISLRDLDRSTNAEVKLTCYYTRTDKEAQEACGKFKLVEKSVAEGNYTGEIILRSPLDFETKRKYIMTILAEDKGSPMLNNTVNVVIEVLDIQDAPPIFTNAPLSLVTPENTVAGTSIGTIRAKDQDEGDPNPIGMEIELVDKSKDWVYLGQPKKTANGDYAVDIMAKAGIDREIISGTYYFHIRATELDKTTGEKTNSTTMTTVTMTIQDMNDNMPTFNQKVYNISVPEGILAKSQLPGLNMIVSDDDRETFAMFTVSIIHDKYKVFTVQPSNVTKSAALQLVVRENYTNFLDYEVPEYRQQNITIQATELTGENRRSTATVIVNLYDVNDNSPVFPLSEYTYSVREDRMAGYPIANITATDRDSGSFGKVTYSLVGDASTRFTVNPKTGEIKLGEKLDFETEPFLSLMFVATDGGGKKTAVPFRVTVIDYNDQGPKFEVDNYETSVTESETVLSPPITIKATDRESTITITYKIRDGNTDDNAFKVDAKTGKLTLTRKLSYLETPNKRGFFRLTVEASDNGQPPQTSTVAITITVKDENDNDPVFTKYTYTGQVTEISAPGTNVVLVNATDKDIGANGEVAYIIYSGSRDNFVINYFTGQIQVAASANLDIDKFGNRYTMLVHAIDKGSPQRTGTASVEVTVSDANNKNPVFPQSVYLLSVNASAPVGYGVINLTASDPDTSANLHYSIILGSVMAKDKNGKPVTSVYPFDFRNAFGINQRNGTISTLTTLDREKVAGLTFTVKVQDKNAEQPVDQSATANVIITITSSTQGGIEFNNPWTIANPNVIITMAEEQPPNTLITTLVARDTAMNRPVNNFRKVPGSDPKNIFRLDTNTGQIFLNDRLDYEVFTSRQVSFQVEAFTTDEDKPRKAMVTVIVQVQDINDHSPQFIQSQYIFRISEKLRFPSQVGIVYASDDDSGTYSRITYSLSGQGSHLFSIEKDMGFIFVAENATLDREAQSTFNMRVTAIDNPIGVGLQRETSVQLTIVILDANDNIPTFAKSEYEIRTMETVSAQTSLGQVYARDPDEGKNAQVSYSIQSGNEGAIFSVDRFRGIIRARQDLNGKARNTPYKLNVKAQDAGIPIASSQVAVTIYVNSLQSNDGRPRFINPPTEGFVLQIPEEEPAGYFVTRVTAVDSDDGLDGELVYGFLSNNALLKDHLKFRIDPDSGNITTAEVLDREKQETYQLVLIVKDKGSPPQEVTRVLTIKLSDKPDNDPSFFNCPTFQNQNPVITYVLEEQPSGTFVAKLEGCDADVKPNNKLYYYIICGNNPIAKFNGSTPFVVNSTTGVISTGVPLDRETTADYTLCIKVTNKKPEVTNTSEPVTTTTAAPANETDPSVVKVKIYVEDVDDNGPKFAGGSGGGTTELSAGVLVDAKFNSRVTRVQAVDTDLQVFSVTKYDIIRTTYHVDTDSKFTITPMAFVIEEYTGIIRTNLASYIKFLNGYFKLTVQARDEQGRTDQAIVYIYVLKENQRLKFVFNVSPDSLRDKYAEFAEDLNKAVKGAELNLDETRYHVKEGGHIDFAMTDVCFHIVKDNKIVDTKSGMKILDAQDSKLETLKNKYTIKSIGICALKQTTDQFEGWVWLWWFLIGLATLIFLLVLIFIIVVCCFWHRYKKYMASAKTYVVLDPVASYPVGAMSKNMDYEWQESAVKMH